MKVYSPWELNTMSLDERKAAIGGDFGRSFHASALKHVTWIFWARDTNEPTDIINHASVFMLDRRRGPILVTAAHVYPQYVADWDRVGPLRCQIANTVVSDLRRYLIACGNLGARPGEPEPEPDIATFRLPAGAVMLTPGEISFGFHSGMSAATSVTEHQIAQRFEREFMIDRSGNGLPPKGYGLGGISGGPLLIPLYRDGAWIWRLGGVISQATEERPPHEVIFEMVVAHRAEYIQADGTLAKSL